MQILIFGMHRSGTSMTARLVNMMGAYFGPTASIGEGKPDNPKGFWERPEVLAINEALLKNTCCSWFDVRGWTPEKAATCAPVLGAQMENVIEFLNESRTWVLKDPRMCLTFPAWRLHLDAPVAVIVHRNPFEIAISLNRRNNFSMEFGVALWEHYAVALLNATRGLPRAYIRYGDTQFMPHRACQDLYDQLVAHGVKNLHMPTFEEIAGFIDSNLYRSHMPNPGAYALTPAQKTLSHMCRGLIPQDADVVVSEESARIIREHTPEHC